MRTTIYNSSHWWKLIFVLCTFLVLYIDSINSAAVMSIDLGNEWMKVGVVSPGVPMEIALNRESKRKTPVVLAFRDGIRTFGEDAQAIGVKYPSMAYAYLMELLGKTIDNPIVELYKKRFPYYEIIGDPERNTVVFKNENGNFNVEELVAQVLSQAKHFAEMSTKQAVTECVLIVPGYFGQAERTALLAAAELADLKVLQLINDYAAVALNYGVFHRNEINETAQYYVYYDIGAQKTAAAVVSYQLVKDKATRETNPVVQVLGVGYDRTLGGLDIQLRLRDYLAKEFNSMKKTKTDVFKSPRALAKLFKEAGRLKNVLSANNEHYAQIENLLEDHDFRFLVKREQLENLCTDLWPRVVEPLRTALKTSGLTMDVINQLIIFGGGTRMPKIQEILRDEIKQELGKSLNADEAAAMGAVYKAADLAIGFKVKKFVVKDAVLFPIQISFERTTGDGTSKEVKRLLFGQMNPFPQKKVITFNKHVDDFEFFANYGDLKNVDEAEISYLGSLNITHIEVKNVAEMLEKNKGENIDTKGFKAHFTLDDSGIFNLTGIDFVYEKQKKTSDEEEEAGTLSKLSSTISKLFSGDSEKVEKSEEVQQETEEKKVDEKSDSNDSTNSTEPSGNATKTDDKLTDSAAKNDTVKILTVKEPVNHKIAFKYVQPLSDEAYEVSFNKLLEINNKERDREHHESTLNTLESLINEVNDKIEQEDFASCASEKEKKEIVNECSATQEWLYDDEDPKETKALEDRLTKLQNLAKKIYARHWEHQERPEALKSLTNLITEAGNFLETAKNLTKENNADKDIFTTVEVEVLEKTITEAKEWQAKETEEQDKLKRSDDVRLKVSDIVEKMRGLDREVKYLWNKMSMWRPKKVKKDKKSKNATNANDTETDSVETEINMDGETDENVVTEPEETVDEQLKDSQTKPDEKEETAGDDKEIPTTEKSTKTSKKSKRKSVKKEGEEETTPHSEL